MLNRVIETVGKVVGGQKLSILIYHQILESADPMRATEPTAATFDWHMRLLKSHYKPLSLTVAVDALRNGTLPKNSICVTFDDGYLNNLTVAAPILRKYQIPATVYVATAFSNGRNMWNDQVIYLFADKKKEMLSLDGEAVALGSWQERSKLANQWLQKLKYLPVDERQKKVDELYRENQKSKQNSLMMNPSQLRELASNDIAVGGHTINHPILKILPEEKQWDEISGCRTELESWLDRPIEHFAYPNGIVGKDLDKTTVGLVKQAGFKSAVVTDWGTSDQSTSPYLLKRFTPWDRSPVLFQLRLLKNALNI